ncbi:uncharacterized protein BDZ99DRAFT_452513 [Mytilinidion resinicola]|uniref:PHD and RING finger domain-containing protein n=1 Tax=Mytilinidion resinicola TaxID=574789 RepID=A0A6A6Y596_9PEZI|nr:uncharacterized protein BDZ99DRAFT_452513 [Mytilinidion resinicola]KAF2804021.1 hypothetical protein BDZ99DRAFT_452513 [Mytilinidion resinicola]
MAESCIVCLGDLAGSGDDVLPTSDPSPSKHSLEDGEEHTAPSLHDIVSPSRDADPDDDEIIAHLLPCGHNLHNECLKPWVERANSCPICRQSFNTVELSACIGGPMLSSYPVQDKQQVADIDPTMFIDDVVILDDGGLDPCTICETLEEPETLMQCHGCDSLCHVFCAGLDSMPASGPWYCQDCVQNPEILAQAYRRPQPQNLRDRISGIRRGHRLTAYERVWASVLQRINLDLDYPFDEENPQRPQRTEAQQREAREYERRLAVASRNGAGNRFRQIGTALLPHRPDPPQPRDPESEEDIQAWNAFEKARAELNGQSRGSSSSGRGRNRRKRKSVTLSPSGEDTEPRQPERKLKRPRTRVAQEIGGESSKDAVAEASTAARVSEPRNSSPPNGVKEGAYAAAGLSGFLQSLLKEVEVTPRREDEIAAPQPRRVIIERACSPPGSSPGLSPVYPTPRGGMTPPPLNLTRPTSPLQASPNLSPGYSPTSRFPPFSPADDEYRTGRRKHHQSPGALSSPPRSKDSSPNRSLSYSTKAEVQRMVSLVLKPFYQKQEITKDQYTDINRDVSRSLYDKVGDANALADQSTREKWQRIAGEEVESAVKALRTDGHDSGTGSNSS